MMNKNSSPLVSILIPTFNSEKFVAHAIESAMAQTYKAIEIVVVDNASSDGTMAILNSYATTHSNIFVYENETNIGPVGNWRRCAELAKGDFAVLLFSDDLLAPDFVSSTLSYLRTPTVGFAYSAVAAIDQDGAERSAKLDYRLPASGVFPMSQFVLGHLLLGEDKYPLSPACALFRTCDMRKNLGQKMADEFEMGYLNHGAGPDLLIYLMCGMDYPSFGHVNQKMAYFRGHDNNLSKSEKVNLAYAMAKAWFAMHYFADGRRSASSHFRAAHLWRLMRLGRTELYSASMGWDASPWNIAWQDWVKYLVQNFMRKRRTS